MVICDHQLDSPTYSRIFMHADPEVGGGFAQGGVASAAYLSLAIYMPVTAVTR
jgi:hypothetical protein